MAETGENKERRDLITIQEAAAEAGLTEAAIRNAVYRGKLAVTEMYGRKLIDRVAFEEYRRNTKMGRPKGSTKKTT